VAAALPPDLPEDLRLLVTGLTEAPFGVSVVGPDLRYLWVNPALAAFRARRPEDYVGHPVGEVLGPYDAGVLDGYRTVLRTGQPVEDLEVDRSDPRAVRGTQRSSLSLSPICAADGRVGAVLGVVVDIRRRRLTEAALERAERNSRILVEATGRLGGGADLDAALTAVGDLLVPRVCDRVVLDLLGSDRHLRRSLLVGRPAREHPPRARPGERFGYPPQHPAAVALQTGSPAPGPDRLAVPLLTHPRRAGTAGRVRRSHRRHDRARHPVPPAAAEPAHPAGHPAAAVAALPAGGAARCPLPGRLR
jgi:hypothetical protein